MIDDFHALQIFLDDFLTGQLDVLIRAFSRPFPNTIDHVLFHENADLFGEIRAGRQFGHTLADDRAFRQIALTDADDILIWRITTVTLAVAGRAGA